MNAKELEDSKLERAFCAAHGQCDFVRQRAIQKLIDQRDAETENKNHGKCICGEKISFSSTYCGKCERKEETKINTDKSQAVRDSIRNLVC